MSIFLFPGSQSPQSLEIEERKNIIFLLSNDVLCLLYICGIKMYDNDSMESFRLSTNNLFLTVLDFYVVISTVLHSTVQYTKYTKLQ